MTVNAFNNIGFPRLSSSSAGMYMPIQNQENKPVKTEDLAQIEKPSNTKKDQLSDKKKYFLGASAIAASAIAGILIVRSDKYRHLKDLKSLKGYFEKMKPNFNFSADEKIENVYAMGNKRMDEMLYPAGINRSQLFNTNGKLIATVDWDLDSKVVHFEINDNGKKILMK